MTYRDELLALRGRLEAARAEALARAQRLGPAQRAVLDETSIARVDQLRVATEPKLSGDPSTVEQAQDALMAVDALSAAYDAVLAAAAARLVCGDLPPDDAALAPSSWRGTSDGAVRLARELRRFLDEAGHPIERIDVVAEGVACRFRAAATPYALLVGHFVEGGERHLEGQIATTIPAAFPPVRVRRERARDALLQGLGIAAEVETGDPQFDACYWLDGSPNAVLAAATPTVRTAMFELVPFGGRLELAGGLARISWSGPVRELGRAGVPPAKLIAAMADLRAALT